MIEIHDDAGRELSRRLLLLHPEWKEGLRAERDGVELSAGRSLRPLPVLVVPSEHPTIRTPLTIELGGTLQLFWHGGYFYDFMGADRAEDALAFLLRFFDETVRCGTRWRNGRVGAGGPVEDDELSGWLDGAWHVEIRSWRGNRDLIVPPEERPQTPTGSSDLTIR